MFIERDFLFQDGMIATFTDFVSFDITDLRDVGMDFGLSPNIFDVFLFGGLLHITTTIKFYKLKDVS